jgi:hypothetical protein
MVGESERERKREGVRGRDNGREKEGRSERER